MTTKRAKSSRKQAADLQSAEDRLIIDPYETIATPVSVCSPDGNSICSSYSNYCLIHSFLLPTDHLRKKNCAKNPWCVYGLGEKEGIWRSTNAIINSLGLDPNISLRATNPKDTNNASLYPPAGLRNLGATCYLNVLIQVALFHLKAKNVQLLSNLTITIIRLHRVCFTICWFKMQCSTCKLKVLMERVTRLIRIPRHRTK